MLPAKDNCCGCELCSMVCPCNAISMIADNEGFLYPTINESACISCFLCERSCPVLHPPAGFSISSCYAGFARDDNELRKSASGSLATALSFQMLENGGSVFGVRYTEEFDGAKYVRVDSYDGLEALRGSKYIQASKGGLYSEIVDQLQAGKPVLVIGLPCEIAAVRKCIHAPLDKNLYLCSLICHGPTSPAVQREYKTSLEKMYGSSLVSFTVRDKKEGWKPYYIKAVFINGKIHSERFLESDYGMAFAYMKRPTCSSCKFKESSDCSDLTIGDYHFAHEGIPQYHPLGSSVALPRTDKGISLIEQLSDRFDIKQVDPHGALMNAAIHRPTAQPRFRKSFSKVFVSKGLHSAASMPFVKLSERKKKLKVWVYGRLNQLRKALKRL